MKNKTKKSVLGFSSGVILSFIITYIYQFTANHTDKKYFLIFLILAMIFGIIGAVLGSKK